MKKYRYLTNSSPSVYIHVSHNSVLLRVTSQASAALDRGCMVRLAVGDNCYQICHFGREIVRFRKVLFMVTRQRGYKTRFVSIFNLLNDNFKYNYTIYEGHPINPTNSIV